MIINAANLEGLFKGYSTTFNKARLEAPSQYTAVAMTAPSQTRETTYAWLGQIPRLKEWLGSRKIRSLSAYGYTIKNKNFEVTVGVAANDIKDDLYGAYSPMIEELGRSAGALPDELIFGLLARGFEELCYDGQNFFDAEHPAIDEDGITPVNVQNYQEGDGAAWFLLDTSRAIKPLVYQEREAYHFVGLTDARDANVFLNDEYLYGVQGRSNAGFGLWQLAYASKAPLTIANYVAARTAMATQRGDEGKLLGIQATTLVVPTTLEGAGRAVLDKQNLAGGESNE